MLGMDCMLLFALVSGIIVFRTEKETDGLSALCTSVVVLQLPSLCVPHLFTRIGTRVICYAASLILDVSVHLLQYSR